jgi:transcriptional regulator with XRE-family HTH domain
MPNIGENIRKLREQNNLSQQALAERMRCSVSTIAGWERGEHRPSRYGKEKLASIFGVETEELERV